MEVFRLSASVSESSSQRLGRMIAELIQSELADDANPAAEPLAYSVQEVLQILPIGRSMFYAEVAAGRLKVFHIGRRTFVLPEVLREYVASCAAA